jgi:6-phosphogluconolactonase (cycloisomerase 2 family)
LFVRWRSWWLALVVVAWFVLVPSALGFAQVPGSPFATGLGAAPPEQTTASVAFSPGGGLLATANLFAGTVSVFSVNPRTGALSAVAGSPFSTGSGPDSVAFSPGGGLLATTDLFAGTVSVFSLNPRTGALSAVAGSPVASTVPVSVAFSPGGGLLATANLYAGTVSVFSTAPVISSARESAKRWREGNKLLSGCSVWQPRLGHLRWRGRSAAERGLSAAGQASAMAAFQG